MKKFKSLRAQLALGLRDIIFNHQSCNSVLPDLLTKLPENQKPIAQAMIYGVLRWYYQLDFYLDKFLTKKLKPKDRDISCLLLLGLYQLKYMRISQHAVVSETVEACKDLKKIWAKGLINAICRNFVRALENNNLNIDNTNLSAYYAHDDWFINIIKKSWPEHWQAILEANNIQAQMSLRVNLLKNSRESYLEKLQNLSIKAHASELVNTAIVLEQPCDVTKLPDFQTGHISVQDIAAQYAAQLLDLSPGQRVLDACCAPGGKTCHILEQEPNLENLTALDNNPERMIKVKENLIRLNYQNKVDLITADGANINSWWDGKCFDRVLLDAPCSATGVIRRHPDIKILRQENNILDIIKTQKKLLESLWQVLSKNGKLVYATCSVLPEENEILISEFLKTHDDAISLDFNKIKTGLKQFIGWQLFPEANKNDGFYYAVLLKNN